MTNIPVKTSSDRRQAGDDELKADLIQQIQIAISCAIAVLCEDKGVIIGGI